MGDTNVRFFQYLRSRSSKSWCRGVQYFSLLARRRYSPTVMAFFWMLYCVKRPDWPVTTCWMGAGMTTSSMSSYVCRGFHSFGGMILARPARWAPWDSM